MGAVACWDRICPGLSCIMALLAPFTRRPLSGGLVPEMCSALTREVARSQNKAALPGLSYRNTGCPLVKRSHTYGRMPRHTVHTILALPVPRDAPPSSPALPHATSQTRS